MEEGEDRRKNHVALTHFRLVMKTVKNTKLDAGCCDALAHFHQRVENPLIE